jgi:hypothetical protein
MGFEILRDYTERKGKWRIGEAEREGELLDRSRGSRA